MVPFRLSVTDNVRRFDYIYLEPEPALDLGGPYIISAEIVVSGPNAIDFETLLPESRIPWSFLKSLAASEELLSSFSLELVLLFRMCISGLLLDSLSFATVSF
jgi:hypothetical protein